MALVALGLLGANTLQAGFACHGENIECAYSATKNGVYTGAFRGTGSPRVVEASFGRCYAAPCRWTSRRTATTAWSGPTSAKRRR